jgi:DNA-binding beta-propeller fold protein YncE
VRAAAALAAALVTAAGCAAQSSGAVTGTVTTGSAAPGGAATAAAGPPRPATLAAVTTSGAVVLLDPSSGAVTRTLVPSGAVGDAIAVSPNGQTVYYEVGTGCQHQIWRVPTAGGSATEVTSAGSAPAISPDGTKLAYARQDFVTDTGSCAPSGDITSDYQLVVLDLATQAAKRYPMPRQMASSGLPAPIGHLSWSADGSHLAVSITSVQDNEGWNLHIMDPSTDATYLSDSSTGDVPMPGAAQNSYYREGVYLPNGKLFAIRQCCGGWPPNTTSVALLEIDPASGQVMSQVAIGLTDRDHTSLDASADGHWLLYLSGHDLEVSQDGAKPTVLASGFVAAAW